MNAKTEQLVLSAFYLPPSKKITKPKTVTKQTTTKETKQSKHETDKKPLVNRRRKKSLTEKYTWNLDRLHQEKSDADKQNAYNDGDESDHDDKDSTYDRTKVADMFKSKREIMSDEAFNQEHKKLELAWETTGRALLEARGAWNIKKNDETYQKVKQAEQKEKEAFAAIRRFLGF